MNHLVSDRDTDYSTHKTIRNRLTTKGPYLVKLQVTDLSTGKYLLNGTVL